jgi:hypothetical protein
LRGEVHQLACPGLTVCLECVAARVQVPAPIASVTIIVSLVAAMLAFRILGRTLRFFTPRSGLVLVTAAAAVTHLGTFAGTRIPITVAIRSVPVGAVPVPVAVAI